MYPLVRMVHYAVLRKQQISAAWCVLAISKMSIAFANGIHVYIRKKYVENVSCIYQTRIVLVSGECNSLNIPWRKTRPPCMRERTTAT